MPMPITPEDQNVPVIQAIGDAAKDGLPVPMAATLLDQAAKLLELLVIPINDTNLEQAAVLISALYIFDSRNQKYNDLWKQGGTEDNLQHLKHKVARIRSVTEVALDREETDGPIPVMSVDDAFDIINYAAFAFRNAVEGRLRDEL